MHTGQRVPTVLAFAARPRLRSVAQQPLTEPECEPLLPGAARPVEQERTRQRIATNGSVEAGAEAGVAVEREEGHWGKVGGRWGGGEVGSMLLTS
jgi:hypothetical protein